MFVPGRLNEQEHNYIAIHANVLNCTCHLAAFLQVPLAITRPRPILLKFY